MQLVKLLIILPFLFFSTTALCQETDSLKTKSTLRPYTKEVKANFLNSYYEQDGNNGAVTGDTGTELLSNIASVITVHIPLDSTRAIALYTGEDNYSSASTDNIDNNMSSESSSDNRGFATVTLNKLH